MTGAMAKPLADEGAGMTGEMGAGGKEGERASGRLYTERTGNRLCEFFRHQIERALDPDGSHNGRC